MATAAAHDVAIVLCLEPLCSRLVAMYHRLSGANILSELSRTDSIGLLSRSDLYLRTFSSVDMCRFLL